MKRNSKMYAWLKERGYMEKDDQHLKFGKKLYRREYLKNHRASWRKKVKVVSISLNANDHAVILTASQKNGFKILPDFIRAGCLAYIQKVYIVPRLESIHQVQLQVLYLRSQIERLGREKKFFGRSRDEQIEEHLQNLEREVTKALAQPADLEEQIRIAIKEQPDFLITLERIASDHAG